MRHILRPVRLALALGCMLATSSGTTLAHPGLDVTLEAGRAEVSAHPTDPEAYFKAAKAYAVAGRWDDALDALAQADATGGDPDHVAVARGRILRTAGRVRLAKREVGRALARRPDSGGALLERARVWRALGQPAKAGRDFDRAIALLSRPTPEHVFECRDAWLAAGRPVDAIRALDDGRARLGEVPSLELAAIELEAGAGRPDAALARIDRLLARYPNHEVWTIRRGELLVAAGRPADARVAFARALALLETRPARRRGPQIEEMEQRLRAALASARPTNEERQ